MVMYRSAVPYQESSPNGPAKAPAGKTLHPLMIGQSIASCAAGAQNMPLLNLVIVLVIVGVLLGLINRYIPMAGSIKQILNIVVVVAVAIWVLQAVGLLGSLGNI